MMRFIRVRAAGIALCSAAFAYAQATPPPAGAPAAAPPTAQMPPAQQEAPVQGADSVPLSATPAPYAPPPPQPAMQPQPAYPEQQWTGQRPEAPSPEAPSAPAKPAYEHEGFHIAFGLGMGVLTGTNLDEPGVITQFKIGYGISDRVRVYYYALNHWYWQSYDDSIAGQAPVQRETETRIAVINGGGVDYFFLPNVGLRLAFGLGGDLVFSRSRDYDAVSNSSSASAFGFAYTIGTTFELTDGAGHFTVDPVLTVVNYDTTKLVAEQFRSAGYSEWKAYPVFGIVLGYSYH